MKNVSESLAARMAIFHLESLSALELRQTDAIHPEDLALVHLRGGYPELWKSPAIDRVAWFEDYIRTYIERDLQELVQVKDLISFRRFLGILAARAGELVNYSNMGLACGVSNNTIKNWLSALEVFGCGVYSAAILLQSRKAPRQIAQDILCRHGAPVRTAWHCL